jgi:hypothetical protein
MEAAWSSELPGSFVKYLPTEEWSRIVAKSDKVDVRTVWYAAGAVLKLGK